MRAAVFHGPHDIRAEQVEDPHPIEPTDAIVRVVAAGVCGSDLWTYRGQSSATPGARIGHEFVGVVEEVGTQVRTLRPGAWVIAPFRFSDGTCVYCRMGMESSCLHGGFWSREEVTGGQGEYVRVPYADGTLVEALPRGEAPDTRLVPSLLALCDVMGTGYHAARRAGVEPGSRVVVVGDGAVGQCAVLSASLLGAELVMVVGSRHEQRRELVGQMGATHAVPVRGDEAVEAVREQTAGLGADIVLECVGTPDAFASAVALTRDGGTIGYVGLPHGVELSLATLFPRNIAVTGGVAPVRHYLPGLLPKVLDGSVDPGEVFTDRLPLTDITTAYGLLDRRATVKPLIEMAA